MTTDIQPTRGFTHLVAVIIIAALVIGAAILASSYLGANTTRTQTMTATRTETMIATATSTTTSINSAPSTTATQISTVTASSGNADTISAISLGSTSTTAALLGTCPSINFSAFYVKVTVGSSSPTLICLRFYYYNSTAPITLNLTKMLTIQGNKFAISDGENQSHSFNAASNFTVAMSRSQLVIGGPTDENEGVNITYAFTAKAGASGTYALAFLPSGVLDTWMAGTQEPLSCGYYVQLVAASGQPNYIPPSGCITYDTTFSSSLAGTTSSSPEYVTIPGIPYPLTVGYMYFELMGATNSIGS